MASDDCPVLAGASSSRLSQASSSLGSLQSSHPSACGLPSASPKSIRLAMAGSAVFCLDLLCLFFSFLCGLLAALSVSAESKSPHPWLDQPSSSGFVLGVLSSVRSLLQLSHCSFSGSDPVGDGLLPPHVPPQSSPHASSDSLPGLVSPNRGLLLVL